MSTAAVTPDPYAAYGGSVTNGNGADPYAAYGGKITATTPAPQTAPASEGFFHNLASEFGLAPEQLQQSAADEKAHPAATVLKSLAGPAGSVLEGLYNQGKASLSDIAQAVHSAASGNPSEATVHAVHAIPIVGPAELKMDQQADAPTGHYLSDVVNDATNPGVMGTGLGAAAQAALMVADPLLKATGMAGAAGDAGRAALATTKTVGSKLVPSLVDGPPESLMTRAIKPGKNNVNWNADVQTAMPLMKSAEQQLGQPIGGIDDALEAADLAKKQVWQQYQARLGPAAQQGATIDGNAVADAMVNSIDKRTALQNPGLVERVKATADTYRGPLSLNDAEDFLQSANKDLNNYYAKNKVGQQVALNDPEMASTVAEGNALRTALYSKLDQLSGPGAAQLKQAYGSLTNIEKELYGRQLVAARQAPESLSEQLGTISGAGRIVKGVATMNPGDILEGAQNIAVSRALKARNSSDAMIARAFQKAQPATPFPMPSSPRFAGLLERGPIQVSSPAPTPSAPSAPAIGIDATTRAQRLGLLLPEQTGGYELAYHPEMTPGERLAALQQLLRRSQPLALPAKATPLRLPPPQ